MSSRAFKNAVANQKLKDFELPSEEEEEEEVVSRPKKGPVNMFAMLDDGNEDNEEEEEEGEDKPRDADVSSPKPTGTPKKKKKAKKKKGGVGDEKEATASPATGRRQEKTGKKDVKGKGKTPEIEEDDIDAQLREINEKFNDMDSHMDTSGQDSEPTPTSLLGVQRKFLSPEAEMKRVFGSRTVNDMSDSRNQRRNHGRYASVRRYWLVTPKPNWPLWTRPGVVMEKLDTDRPGEQWFTYVHSKAYQEVQYMFLAAVETMDPNSIVALINRYPYHIDSLLQLSEICAIQGDHPMALELVERALYVFESNFHAQFKPGAGTCKVEYKRFENRAFFLALFRYIAMLGQKGCWRTALEFSKFLLSLDDTDPLCALLIIDFYAMRAREHTFLIRLYDMWDPVRHLHLLPNFAYSIALAHFHKEQEAPPQEEGVRSANDVKSNLLLQRAMLLFPMVLVSLADKADIDLDATVAADPFFAPIHHSASMNDHDRSVLGLTTIYVQRAFSMWKEPQIATWVRANASAVCARLKRNDPEVEECRQMRLSVYRTPGSRAVHRHILLSGVREAISTLPASVSHEPMNMYDPLPPANGINPYVQEQPRAPTSTQAAISMFIRSLIPSFTVEDGAELANREEGGGMDIGQLLGGLDMATLRDVLRNAIGVAGGEEGEGIEVVGEGEGGGDERREG